MPLWPRRSAAWLAACALAIVTAAAYGNSFEAGFVFDNRTLLLEDSRIHKATLDNLALIVHHTYWWPQEESGLYRPITTMSYLFNYAILGNAERPAGYHWINLLLHAGNVILLFMLARRLLDDVGRSFLIALVWAVHPVLTESVTNVVGRSDLLAGITSLGGLLIYLKSAETRGGRRLAWLAGLTAITAIGVFSKESAVAVFGIVALYEVTWWDPSRLRGFLLGCLAMAPAFLAMWWIRSKVMAASATSRFPFVDNPIVGADFWTGRLTAVKVMAKYLGLLFWPAHLSADYSYRQIPLADGRLTDWIGWIAVSAVTIGVIFLFRRNKPAFFGASFAFLTFLPASNLVIPFGTIMAERLLYLPAAGFAVCLVLALYSVAGRLRAPRPAVLCLLIAAGFGLRTWARNADWRDDVALWSAAVQTSPLSFKAHTGLAQALHAGSDLDGALRENEKSVAILDPLPDQRSDAGIYLRTGAQYIEKGYSLRQPDRDGKPLTPPESISSFERARVLLLRGLAILQSQHKADRDKGQSIKTDADTDAYLMLSETDQRLGRKEDALRWAREAQAVGPLRLGVYGRIHDILLAAGRRDEGLAVLMEGWLLTSNPELQRKLMTDYADHPDEIQCAISYAEAAPRIDFSCAIVRQQVCSVSGEVIRLGMKATDPPTGTAGIRRRAPPS